MVDTDEHALDAAVADLYGGPPDEFLAARAGLSKQAAADGHPLPAKQIAALRKPTVPASLVNRMVLADPSAVHRLADLYDRLRQAHEDLDAPGLRELSGERRAVVGELAAAALAIDERTDPPTAVRDDVTATLDAAVADPGVLARLGRLTKPERWSGFGVAAPPTDGPALTLVHGGRTRRGANRPAPSRAGADGAGRADRGPTGGPGSGGPRTSADPSGPAGTAGPSAQDKREASALARRRARAREKAQAAFDAAESALAAAEESEQRGFAQVKAIAAHLTDLQAELEATKRELDKSRREVKSARGRRREARSALDRIERHDG